MSCPPPRTLSRLLVIPVLTATLVVTPAAAQQPDTGLSPVQEAAVAALVTLVVGGGLIQLAPQYTDRTTRRIHVQPWRTLAYGVGIGLVVMVATVFLLLTRIGIILVIPLAIVTLVFGELGYLAVGRALFTDWGTALLVAMCVSAIVGGVPILGLLLGLVLSSLGLGTAYLDHRDGGRVQPSRSRGADLRYE